MFAYEIAQTEQGQPRGDPGCFDPRRKRLLPKHACCRITALRRNTKFRRGGYHARGLEGNRRLIHTRSGVVDLSTLEIPPESCQKWMFPALWRGEEAHLAANDLELELLELQERFLMPENQPPNQPREVSQLASRNPVMSPPPSSRETRTPRQP
jgi:hypothetical protein